MTTLLQDIKFGLRTLAKNPGFTTVAVLTLALGIGANTAIFSVVNGVLLSPLPYSQPDRLVALYSSDANFSRKSISYPNFLDWVRDNRSFSDLAAYREDDFTLTGTGEPERVPVEMISASFFPLLGVKPVIGRPFTPEEDQVGAGPVVLISEGFWNRKFGASREVLGKSIQLNSAAYTIVGVIPSSFHYHGNNFHRSDAYTPIGQWNDTTFRDRRASMGMDAVGRLKPGVTFEQAKTDMDSLARQQAQAFPVADKDQGITLVPLKSNFVGYIQPFLLVLLAAVGFVLLIACANVANLLLARSTARTREFAIRCALGAGRSRVVRQLLTESLLLALAGGGLGLLLASWGLEGALKVLPEALPRTEEVHLDGRVLAFMLITSALAGILFGLAPALKNSRGSLQEVLKEGGRGSSGTRHRAQRVFVVAEMALAVVLLAGAGLMIRTLKEIWKVDPGFDPRNVLTFDLSFSSIPASPEAVRAHWRHLHEILSATPGIEASSLSAGSSIMQSDSEVPFWLDGQPKPSTTSEMKNTLFYIIQPEYLKVMGFPLRRGRFIAATDNHGSPLVTVIDERFAQIAFKGEDPIGKRVRLDFLNEAYEVVGVVGHVKQWGLDSDSSSPIQAQCYLPIEQIPDQFLPLFASAMGVVARTSGAPTSVTGSVRRTLAQAGGEDVMYGAESMEGIISDSLAARRFSMVLLGVFAGLALIMSCVGIYGVVSYLVGQRLHEVGIRMALGAERGDVLRMVLADGAKMTLAGVAIGLASAFALTRLMSKMLYGISAHDPLSYAGVAGLLSLVALLACFVPAMRATRVDPVVALRYE